MSKILADLAIRLSMDTAELKKGIKSTKKSLNGFQKSVNTLKSTMLAAFSVTAIIGAGKAISQYTKKMYEASQRMKQMSSLTGKALTDATAKVLSISKVYNAEFADVSKSAQTLVTNFGISFEKALDIITDGFAKGGNLSGEMLESIKEYPAIIRDAGISAQQMVDIIATSEQMGIFNDKGIDAIKEVTLRIREMTPATKDAIKGIGLSVEAIEEGLRSGELTIADVIVMISEKMKELGPTSQEVGVALADIWGGAGEDAGTEFIESLGSIIEDGYQGIITESEMMKKELVDVTAETNAVIIDNLGTDLWTAIKLAFAKGINAVVTNIADISHGFQYAKVISTLWLDTFFRKARVIFQAVGEMINTYFNPANWFDKGAVAEQMSMIIIAAKDSLSGIEKVFKEYNQKAKDFFFGEVADDAEDLGKTIGDGVVDGVKKAVKESMPDGLASLFPKSDIDMDAKPVDTTSLVKEYSEANERITQNAADQAQQRIDFAQKEKERKVQNIRDWADIAMNATTAIADIFEAQKQRELSAAGDNAEKREAIEKKYFKKQKRLAIAEAFIATGLAVLNAMQTKPFLPMGLAMAVTAGAMGAAQIAMIASQNFATGGIVPGTSYTGDNVLANVNSGEMILTTGQQANLFKALDQGGLGGQVIFRIDGTELVGVLEKQLNINSIY